MLKQVVLYVIGDGWIVSTSLIYSSALISDFSMFILSNLDLYY